MAQQYVVYQQWTFCRCRYLASDVLSLVPPCLKYQCFNLLESFQNQPDPKPDTEMSSLTDFQKKKLGYIYHVFYGRPYLRRATRGGAIWRRSLSVAVMS